MAGNTNLKRPREEECEDQQAVRPSPAIDLVEAMPNSVIRSPLQIENNDYVFISPPNSPLGEETFPVVEEGPLSVLCRQLEADNIVEPENQTVNADLAHPTIELPAPLNAAEAANTFEAAPIELAPSIELPDPIRVVQVNNPLGKPTQIVRPILRDANIKLSPLERERYEFAVMKQQWKEEIATQKAQLVVRERALREREEALTDARIRDSRVPLYQCLRRRRYLLPYNWDDEPE